MIPVDDEDRLLLIPGPTPVQRQILVALGRPTISHTSVQLANTFKSALEGLQTIARNADGKVFVMAGSGTLAQEAALINFVTPSDRLLVAANGFFAGRLHEIAHHHGLNSTLREAERGTSITPDELDRAMQETGATVVAFTHVETSTGVMAPLAEFMEVINRRNAMALVDGVAAFGGIPEPMNELGIDVLLTGAQKALGVPPGLAIVFCSSTAWSKRESRSDTVPSFYADLARWAPVMEQPDKYFSTHPVNLIQALAAGIRIIAEEGVETRYERHRQMASNFRTGLSRLGFESFTDERYLAPTLSAILTPPAVTSSNLRKSLHRNGVVAAAGLDDAQDRVVRFGHMGNISQAEIAIALDAIGRSLTEVD